MINLQIVGVGVDDLLGIVREIVNGALQVRQRIEGKQPSGDRVPPAERDGTTREGRASGRINDLGGKNALVLRGEWDRCDLRRRVAFPRTLPASEEECLVMNDWPAKGGPELVLNEPGVPAGGLKIGCRVEPGVAQELEQVAVETIGAGPHGDIDDSAGSLSELG